MSEPRLPMLTRRFFLSRATATAAISAAFALMGVGYAVAVEPFSFKTTRYRITPEGWPEGRRMRIAMLADFHANASNMDEADIASVVEATNALGADLIVLMGDYCSQDPGSLTPETVLDGLRGLKAPQGVFAIQGNHDWRDDREACGKGHGPTRTERALHGAGIALLENRAVPLGDGSVWLAGIESEQTPGPKGAFPKTPADLDALRAAKMRETLAEVPAGTPVILLAHEPDVFALDLDPRLRITLSGHTHGGQVRIFGWSPWIPSRYGLRYAYGHIVERARHLVVSGGLGSHFVAGRPLRVGVPPEVVMVEVGYPDEAGV